MVLRSVVELLAHLTGTTIRDGVLSFDGANSKFFSEKESPSYHTFQVIFLGFLTGEHIFQTLVILARCNISSL